jgi:hypothetical protein
MEHRAAIRSDFTLLHFPKVFMTRSMFSSMAVSLMSSRLRSSVITSLAWTLRGTGNRNSRQLTVNPIRLLKRYDEHYPERLP